MSKSFEDLKCYQRSAVLVSEIIIFSRTLPDPRVAHQITASALSIPSNIAEGSQGSTVKECRRYLRYAVGSACELYAQLYVLLLIDDKDSRLEEWRSELVELRKMIAGLIKAQQ